MSVYLDRLDTVLHAGVASLSEHFRNKHAAFVISRQQPEGGFTGRSGAADIYYTDFAVRSLTMLGNWRHQPALHAAQRYLQRLASGPGNVIECFNRLNLRRMLGGPKRGGYMDVLRRHLLRHGGFTAYPGSGQFSVYQTFLGLLCMVMLGKRTWLPRGLRQGLASVLGLRFFPDLGAAHAICGLQCQDGGFSEISGQNAGQTNATAAAVGILEATGTLTKRQTQMAGDFLVARQCPDGGLAAHADLKCGDLLSTFTGLITLGTLSGGNAARAAAMKISAFERLNLGNLGRFVRDCASPDGGFRASAGDAEADVEYTYYGVATAGLLRSVVFGA